MRKIILLISPIISLLFVFTPNSYAICTPPTDICRRFSDPALATPGYIPCSSSNTLYCKTISNGDPALTDPDCVKTLREPWLDASEACKLRGIENTPADPTIANRKDNICKNLQVSELIPLLKYNWAVCSACIKMGGNYTLLNTVSNNATCKDSGRDMEVLAGKVVKLLEQQGYDKSLTEGTMVYASFKPPGAGSTSNYTPPPADPLNKKVCEYFLPGDLASFNKCNNCMKDGSVWTSLGCIKAADPYAFVGQIITWAVILGAGLATAIIGFQGLQIVMAGDDPKKVKASQEAITAAISGLLLIVFSIMLMNILGIKILNLSISGLGFWKL